MYKETAYEYLGVANNAVVQAINCLTRDEKRQMAEGKELLVISSRTCLDRLYAAREDIMLVMEEQKKVAQ